MTYRRRAFVLVVLSVAALSAWPTYGAESALAPEPKESIEDATRFRAEFGLRSDTAFVRGTLTNPESFPDHSWGVPLSVAEATDLQERVLATEASQAAVSVAVDTEGYAGVYFDQLREGLAVFVFTDVSPERASAVVDALPNGINYELREVNRPGFDGGSADWVSGGLGGRQ